MNPERLSAQTQELLRAARYDGPSSTSRDRMWGQVSSATAAAAVVAATSKTALASAKGTSLASGLGGGKLVLTTIFGTIATVGSAVVLMHLASAGRTPGAHTTPSTVSATVERERGGAAHLVSGLPSLDVAGEAASLHSSSVAISVPTPRRLAPAADPAAPKRSGTVNPAPHSSVSQATLESGELPAQASGAVALTDHLAEEATLIADARAALVRGDGEAALRRVNEVTLLGETQLAPEALALEVRALRLLGRSAEAASREAAFKARFPDQALLR